MRKNSFKKICASLCLLGAILLLGGCGEREIAPVTMQSYYFDTICQITVYDMTDESDGDAAQVISDAFSECSRYENLLSKTKEGTEVYQINHAGGAWVECSPETIEVIQMGISYGDLSEGLFDITIGKAADLYDFHEEDPAVPTEEQLSAAAACIDYKQIEIQGSQVRLTVEGGEIDLGGIGKGYVADRIAEYLEEHGVTSAIISLGGNIECVGDKKGEDFVIGIEKPFSSQSAVVGTVTGGDLTLVTSGIYERYFEKDGVFYHHILDPKTGKPVDTDLYGVTILGGQGQSGDCDALATICLMLGQEKGLAFMENLEGYEALFIDKSGAITMTSGMVFQAAESGA